ncbi:DUF4652 domain-containing protein [Sutcliffiella cohnii]|uniref:DUF4652 domain-containing protein n=1 Tax=Sutcliffiella cohnii TaxID=33932 RepID=UPI002E1E433A|nr:DUF4652 domain-containing protein [Sutcliffiella cohnii]
MMYQLMYDEVNEKLIQINPSGESTIITEDFPSKPEVSPDKKKAIYISPLEWERSGSLYMYDMESGYIKEVICPDKDGNIPKYAVWLNKKTIALIKGYGDGTVGIGGNVFIYDIEKQQLTQITHFSSRIQITKLLVKGKLLILRGIRYTDDNFSAFKEYEEVLLIDEILMK